GFPSAAIASSSFTARCDSIWYGFFIATLLFLRKRNCSQPIKGFERGVATFYDLPGILALRELVATYASLGWLLAKYSATARSMLTRVILTGRPSYSLMAFTSQ